MTIFRDDRDYRRFLQVLDEVVDEFKVECLNYCGMPNHYHATIRPTLPNISDAMQALNSRYAQWWNWRHNSVGHVFQGRFKAQIVEREQYALVLSRYIAMNPVRARLVERPEDWRWSSYAATIGLCDAPSFLSTQATLALLGEADSITLQKRFANFVNGGHEDDVTVDHIRSNALVLGSDSFKAAVLGSDGGQTMV